MTVKSPAVFKRKRFEPREALETRTEKLTCPFCKRERSVKIVKAARGEFFSITVEECKEESLALFVGCKCGARFIIYGGEMPKDYTSIKVAPGILAAKPRIEIEEVALKGKKKGKVYRWKQTQLKIPRAFQTIMPGLYTIYHEGEDIILRPVKAAS